MLGKSNSTMTRIWDTILSQMSEIMSLIGLIKVKSQTSLAFAALLCTKGKCSSIMGQYDILKYIQL